MKHLLILLLLLLAGSPGVVAQQQVTFNVKPANSFVRVDGQVLDLLKHRTIDLPSGTYKAELWSPKFQVREISVNVVEGNPLIVNENLRLVSVDYDAYREELSTYNTVRFGRTIKVAGLGVLTGGLVTATAVGRRPRLDELRREIRFHRGTYETSLSVQQINDSANDYGISVEEFGRVKTTHNTMVVTTGILAGATAILLVRQIIKQKRHPVERPDYQPNNPFLNKATSISPTWKFGAQASPLGLTFTF